MELPFPQRTLRLRCAPGCETSACQIRRLPKTCRARPPVVRPRTGSSATPSGTPVVEGRGKPNPAMTVPEILRRSSRRLLAVVPNGATWLQRAGRPAELQTSAERKKPRVEDRSWQKPKTKRELQAEALGH